jgi:hypothetical protein
LAAGLERALAQTKPATRHSGANSPLLVTSPILEASLQRISKGSPLWREAIELVRQTGRQALIATPAEVTMLDERRPKERRGFDAGLLAEAVPIVLEDSRIATVVVVVNVPLLQEVHDARLSVPRHFESDLDRILVHEIYAHAVPYLLAGDRSGRCADPAPGERPSDACSIRRENAVRAELGLGRRGDDGVSSLTLAWGRLY